MTTEEVFRVIDRLKKANVKNIILTGGEALLRKDIVEIAQYIKQEGFFLTVLTNGVLLGAKRRILEYIDSSIISIDTLDAQKNLRKGLDIDALITNLKEIEQSLRSKIYLRCVISKQDMDSWKSIKEFCKQNNYKFLKSIYIPGSKDEIELVPTVEGVKDNEESSENTTNMGGSVCGASYKEIAIDANGDVYPCRKSLNYLKEEIWIQFHRVIFVNINIYAAEAVRQFLTIYIKIHKWCRQLHVILLRLK